MYYYWVFGVGNLPGVIFDQDSLSGVTIEKGGTVTELRKPEILKVKFSRPALLSDPMVLLNADSESVVRLQKSCTVPEIFAF